jgi:glycosyltransferase involved in cell wall biosynthesis
MNKDLLDDQYGRFREIPLALGLNGHKIKGLCLSYVNRNEGWVKDGPVLWKSINATPIKLPGLFRFINEAQRFTKKSDVIWACSDSFYGIIGYMLSSKYQIPLIFDLYDNFEYYLMAKLPVIKQLYRRVIKKSDAVTCVSHPLSHLVKSYRSKRRVYVLENGVRENLFIPMKKKACRKALKLPKNSRIVGTAGALESSRGIQILFKAFDFLKTIHPDLHLAVAGPRKSTIPIGDRIHDLGVLPFEKVPLFLNALDVAIICNQDNEFGRYCFPQKAREIMACDTPLVTAKVGSLKELFRDHPDWLYDPGSYRSLARVLENRLTDRTTAYIPSLTWTDLAKILEDIMLKTLSMA